MTIEELVQQALNGLAAGRIFPDFAPVGTLPPFITYQAVGGRTINYQTGETPDKTNARVQINVWANTRLQASALGAAVEDAIRGTTSLQPEVLTGRVATFDEETTYRGTMQDFSLWY